MLIDIVSRLVLFLNLFNSDQQHENSSSSDSTSPGIFPNKLSSLPFPFEDLFNDTVIIENPYLGEDYDDGSYSHELITLPICCDFQPAAPAGDGDDNNNGKGASIIATDPFCPSGSDDWQKNNEHKGKIYPQPLWYPAPHLFPSENRSHYRFQVRKPSCASPLKEVKLSTDEFEVASQGRFLRNGYFGYNNDEFYSPHEYCISGLTGEFVQVMICDSSSSSPCSWGEKGSQECIQKIQKCCNPDEIYSFSRRQCIKSKGALFSPIFYHDLSHQLSDSEQRAVHPHYHIAFPRSFKYRCMFNKTLILPAGAEFAQHLTNFTNKKYYSAHFKIRSDGRIMFRKDGKAKVVVPEGLPIYLQENSRKCYTLAPTSHYCIDGAAEYGSPNPFNNDEGEIFLVTCPEYLFDPPKIGPLSFVYGNVMITSSLFALLTVLVYAVLKDKHNIHGWTIASYAFSMFLMYIFLALAHLIRYYGSDDVLKTAGCVTVGIASHLFSMSSFLWLTLMNWDIWWTFRKFRPSTRKRGGKEVKHFLTYSSFGWGIPLLITGISSFLHFKYEEASEDDCAVVGVPLPAYGRESCEIKQLSLGVYLYFPAAALLLCNLLFFIVTTYRLCRHSQQTQLATKNLERHHQSVQLFAKLFFVMGVTRVFEVISWAESGPTLTWYWAVFDIFNVLQAVAIFIIYVCKRDVLLSLKKLFFNFYYGQQGHSGTGTGGRERRTVSAAYKDVSVAAPLLITGSSSASPETGKLHRTSVKRNETQHQT